jgi:hypothetical protein
MTLTPPGLYALKIMPEKDEDRTGMHPQRKKQKNPVQKLCLLAEGRRPPYLGDIDG